MSQAGIITSSGSSSSIQFTADSGVAVPAAGNVNIVGGAGITTSAAGSTITITSSASGYAWSEQNADFNIVTGNAYFCNSLLTASLPATGGLVIGDSCIIYANTASTVTIQANTGQFIQQASLITVAGGIAESLNAGASLELVFNPSDLTWHCIAVLSSWNFT